MFFHDPSLYGLTLPYKDLYGTMPQKDMYGTMPWRDVPFGYTPWQTVPRYFSYLPQQFPQQYGIPQTFANFPVQYPMNFPFVPQVPMTQGIYQPWNFGWQRPVTC